LGGGRSENRALRERAADKWQDYRGCDWVGYSVQNRIGESINFFPHRTHPLYAPRWTCSFRHSWAHIRWGTPGGQAGLVPVQHDESQISAALTPRRKRKLGDAKFEVADSEDDEDAYGWDDEDGDAIPPMPSQWQGSEDLLIDRKPDEDGALSEVGSNSGDDGTESLRRQPSRDGIPPSDEDE
jgi:hypothetical protein